MAGGERTVATVKWCVPPSPRDLCSIAANGMLLGTRASCAESPLSQLPTLGPWPSRSSATRSGPRQAPLTCLEHRDFKPPPNLNGVSRVSLTAVPNPTLNACQQALDTFLLPPLTVDERRGYFDQAVGMRRHGVPAPDFCFGENESVGFSGGKAVLFDGAEYTCGDAACQHLGPGPELRHGC